MLKLLIMMWVLQGVELQHNMSAGVMMNGKDLAIRGLRRADSGSYTCTAANIEGRTTSNAVRLAVRREFFFIMFLCFLCLDLLFESVVTMKGVCTLYFHHNCTV